MTPIKIALFLVIAALAAAVVVERQSINKAHADIQALQQQINDLTPLAAENERLSNAVVQASSVTPEQVHELAKLRAEVTRLRGQSSEIQAANQRAQKIAQEAEQLRGQLNDAIQSRRNEAQASEAIRAQNACINNLRLIDAAKQQWALEKQKQVTDIPGPDDLRPYLGRGAAGELPTCPAGGTYVFGAINQRPTCSIPGHVLP